MAKTLAPASSFSRLALGLALLVGVTAARAQTSAPPLNLTTVAGQVGGRGADDGTTAAKFFNPAGLALDSAGNIYVADTSNNALRKITSAGVVSTFAGLAVDPGTRQPVGGGTADGTGSAAQFNFGSSIIAGGIPFGVPIASTIGSTNIAIDRNGILYVADTLNNTIRRVTAAGVVTTIAGSPGDGGRADGAGTSARFSAPIATAVDSAGNIYVADSGNNTIRKITPAGNVSTLAGAAGNAGLADGLGTGARFNNPSGLVIDANGVLFVADTNNHSIRRVAADGTVSTFAGSSGKSGSSDGLGTLARFNQPAGLAIDSAGNIFVADTANQTIRRISSGGVVATIAGLARSSGSTSGTGNAARFNQPYGIAVDATGSVYIADTINQTIRKGVATTASTIQITGQPASRTLLIVGQSSTLSVTATANGNPLSYQWQKNGVDVAGGNGPVYQLPPVTGVASTGTYTVVLTSGSTTLTSQAAQVEAFFDTGGIFPTGLFVIIAVQPVGRTVVAGQPITLSVAAVGQTTVPTYQWFKVAADLTGVPVAGATAPDFTLTAAQPSDAGDYYVVAQSGGTSESSNTVSLTVTAAPVVPVSIVTQPVGATVIAGQLASFNVAATGSSPITYQWTKNGTNIAGATDTVLSIASTQLADAGTYQVVVTNAAGAVQSQTATLLVNPASAAPQITAQPSPASVEVGQPVTFSAAASGVPTPTFQWQKNGINIAGATTATYTISSAQLSDNASFRVVATNSAGTATSNAAALIVAVPLFTGSRIVNLSILTSITAGEGSFSMGAVVGGNGTSGTKALLTRAVGPSLAAFGTVNPLPDPKMSLIGAGNVTVASNDNWGGSAALSDAFAAVGAFAFTTPTSRDAALFQTALPGGNYAIAVSDVGTGTGSVLAELYDATPSSAFLATTPRLLNVSIFKNIGAGLAAGFVIRGEGSKTVLIRAIGPSLTAFGISATDALADPRFDLIDSQQRIVGTNDNWGGTAALTAAFTQVGAFLLPNATSRDAALLITLQPGNYSVSVAGVGGARGITLLEVYDVPSTP